jgi:hypothetical protein
MQIHHEREEALRGRMIEAADEFTRKAIEALNSLSRLVEVLQPEDLTLDDSNGIDYEDVKAMADRAFAAPAAEARQLVDETRIRLARVHLLFGSESDAGRQASELIGQMSFGVTIFDDEPGIPAVELGRRQLDRSRTGYEHFSREVRRAIRRPAIPAEDEAGDSKDGQAAEPEPF